MKAYAINPAGTSHGNELSFTTESDICHYINGESLLGFNSHVIKISPSSSAEWQIDNGYTGNGFALTDNNYGGYVEFSITLSNTAKMTFWTKSLNPGYQNRTPVVTIDGIQINTTLIDGSTSYSYWMKLETQNIPAGNRTIRISFPQISTYYEYYIDEIEFRCQ